MAKEKEIAKEKEEILNKKETMLLSNEKNEYEGSLESLEEDIDENLEDIEELEEDLEKDAPSTNMLSFYFKSISEYKPFTREEEEEVFRRLQENDPEAPELIFKANAKLVPFVAKKLYPAIADNASMDMDDLISAGNLGLLKAIFRFDPSKGFRFSTYAYHWIFSFIERTIANEANPVRLPVHMQEKIRKLKNLEKSTESKQGRELTIKEKENLARKVFVSDQEYNNYNQCRSVTDTVSLNSLVSRSSGDDSDTELIDFVGNDDRMCPEQEYYHAALREEMDNALNKCLPKRNRDILRMRFGFDTGRPMTLEEIAAQYGITRERVRQIEAKSIRILRRDRKIRGMLAFMENL